MRTFQPAAAAGGPTGAGADRRARRGRRGRPPLDLRTTRSGSKTTCRCRCAPLPRASSMSSWASLVGVELDHPVLTDASRAANFINETGVDGTIRYLRNVMGLWLLQESVRARADAGQTAGLRALLAEGAGYRRCER